MNNKIALTLLTATLTACGGGGGGGGGSSDDVVQPYTSPTCMNPAERLAAGIDLRGVTIENACINEESTSREIVLESSVGRKVEFEVSDNINHLAVAKYYLYMDKKYQYFRENIILDYQESSKNVTEKQFEDFIKHLNVGDEQKLARFLVTLPDATEGVYIVNSLEGVSFELDLDEVDFSITAMFHAPGEYKNMKRKIHFTKPRVDSEYSEKELERIAEKMAPRDERYRFIIK